MLALPAKGDSPGTFGDFDSSSETTHGSQASSNFYYTSEISELFVL